MNNIIQINNISVDLSTDNDSIFASTKDIASVFEKEHKHVVAAVKNLTNLQELIDESKIMTISYTDSMNREQTAYALDRDVFSFVCLGFTGKGADSFKWDYIKAFNIMEENLKEQAIMIAEAGQAALVKFHKAEIATLEAKKKELNTYAGGMVTVGRFKQVTSLDISSDTVWNALEHYKLVHSETRPTKFRMLSKDASLLTAGTITGTKGTPIFTPSLIENAVNGYLEFLEAEDAQDEE